MSSHPDFLHGPEGCLSQRVATSTLAELLSQLREAFHAARCAGLCRVAASSFAAQHFSQPFSQAAAAFRMRAHLSDRPPHHPSNLCTCASSFSISSAAHSSPAHSDPHCSSTHDRAPHAHQSLSPQSDDAQHSSSPACRQHKHHQLLNRYKRSKALELQNNVCRLFEEQYKPFDCNGELIDAAYDDSPQLTKSTASHTLYPSPAPSPPQPCCSSPSSFSSSPSSSSSSSSPSSSAPSSSSTASSAPALSHTPPPATSSPPLYGCKHYPRRCKLKAPCCGIFVPCRFCHDETVADDHQMDRFVVDTVLCMVCMTEQPIAPKCVHCSTQFARYYCPKCRFFDNSPGKHIYHCDRCHVCRLGKGIGIDTYHCEKCDACVSIDSKNNHRCLNRALHANCPICHAYLFTSVEPVVFMKCGHTMHKQCFEQYTLTHYQCPICMRSLTDTKQHFENIDKIMEAQTMPPEYACKRSQILCNDCQKKSVVPFHFVYHKCAETDCGSYNTSVIKVIDEPLQHSNSESTTVAPPQDNTTHRSSAPSHPSASSVPIVVPPTPTPTVVEDAAGSTNAWQFII